MKLSETAEMMLNEDYKMRFRAEYKQLTIRMEGLETMLKKYKEGTLNFKPSCSYDLLDSQLGTMATYALILRKRAEIEKIDLD